MPLNRMLLRQALSELVPLRSVAENPLRFRALLYTSALEEWAGQLGVNAGKLDRLVLVREAVSQSHPH